MGNPDFDSLSQPFLPEERKLYKFLYVFCAVTVCFRINSSNHVAYRFKKGHSRCLSASERSANVRLAASTLCLESNFLAQLPGDVHGADAFEQHTSVFETLRIHVERLFLFSLETFHIKIRKTQWFQTFYMFIPKIGEDEPVLTSIFFKGVGLTTTWLKI